MQCDQTSDTYQSHADKHNWCGQVGISPLPSDWMPGVQLIHHNRAISFELFILRLDKQK
jgi:hypothetical protein